MIQRITLLILILCVCAVGVFAATFGIDAIGLSNSTLATIEGTIRCNKATPATNGTATNISWYTYSTGDQNSKGAIYAYVSDTDAGELLAESSEDPGAVDNAWRTGTITEPIVAGTAYFLCAFSGSGAGANNIARTATGGIEVSDAATYPTFSNPLEESGTGVQLLSIYVTYTETASGKSVVLGGGLF
jgi:hypothetical protein